VCGVTIVVIHVVTLKIQPLGAQMLATAYTAYYSSAYI
jgi:hypothetical protein